ncbi:hypothetical protein A9K55_009333 [Cordyceps militaris]|uniref:Uncharacterized protein n=1 Tax=Cordyceps militaris TaxID=73501 RepID=A0A2H4SJ06_CORMI|nr:hypothetical protein A9K55_009333 [Cordyceps militaris]
MPPSRSPKPVPTAEQSILDKAKPWVEDDDCASFDNFLPASLLSANSPSGHYNTAYHFASILGVLGRRNTSTRAFRNKDGSIDERPLTLLAYNSGDVLPLPKHECDGPHAASTAKSLSAVLLNGILCCCVRANAGSDVPASLSHLHIGPPASPVCFHPARPGQRAASLHRGQRHRA